MKHLKSYSIPFIFSFLLHTAVIAILIFSRQKMQLPTLQHVNSKVVTAVTIDKKIINEEVQRIKKQKLQQALREQRHQKYLQQQEQTAKRQRLKEQRLLAALQAKQLKLKQQTVQHEAQLKQQKLRELAEYKKLQQLKIQHQKMLRQNRLALKRQHALKQQQLKMMQQTLSKQLWQQQLQREQQALSKNQSKRIKSIIDHYKSLILQAIQQQWIIPANTKREMSCLLLIHLGPGGVVLDVKTLHSSQNHWLDQSARVAVFKASPLPVPQNPSVFERFRELRLLVRPLKVQKH